LADPWLLDLDIAAISTSPSPLLWLHNLIFFLIVIRNIEVFIIIIVPVIFRVLQLYRIKDQKYSDQPPAVEVLNHLITLCHCFVKVPVNIIDGKDLGQHVLQKSISKVQPAVVEHFHALADVRVRVFLNQVTHTHALCYYLEELC